jgi:phage baseplate assembly protein W
MDGSVFVMTAYVEGYAISFPFAVNSAGGISYATNDATIWEDRVRCVLFTNLTERVMRPDFGTRLAALAFENESNISYLAEQICRTAFAIWLPQLKLNDIQATADEVNGGVNVQVNYETPQGYVETISAKTLTLNRYGEIVQGA